MKTSGLKVHLFQVDRDETLHSIREDSSGSPQDSTGNEVYVLAPGEGQTLVFEDSHAEYKAFQLDNIFIKCDNRMY